MILTANQIKQLSHLEESQKVKLDVNLGHTPVLFFKKGTQIHFENRFVYFSTLKKIKLEEDALYYLDEKDGEIFKVQLYSNETNKYYRLVYCGENTPPTVEISGIKMHVTEGQNPKIDTRKKINSFHSYLHGNILDTCCGLGYTSIHAASIPQVSSITVVEKDPNILSLCRINPFSRELFDHPKISLILGDVFNLVHTFPDSYFHFIIHDPPRFALAPELYSLDFYRNLYRILKFSGELYHYTGNPNKALRKQSLQAKTINRLKEAGFSKVKKTYQGVWAKK